jgi:hypothetical protein
MSDDFTFAGNLLSSRKRIAYKAFLDRHTYKYAMEAREHPNVRIKGAIDDAPLELYVHYIAYDAIIQSGLRYCSEVYGAVHRVGCECCYGAGPDVYYEIVDANEDGDKWINYYVG